MKALDIALKDITQSFRSIFLIGMTIIAPLVISGLLFFAFGGTGSETPDLPALKLGVVNLDQPDEDQSNLGELMLGMFTDPSVSTWLVTTQYPDEQSARSALDRQELGVAVVIPAGFSQAIIEGTEKTEILVIQDPTMTITPSVVRNMIQSFLDGIYGGRVAYEIITERAATHGVQITPDGIQSIFASLEGWYRDMQRVLFHSPDAPLVLRSVSAPDEQSAGGMQQIIRLIMVGQMIFFAFFTAAYTMLAILKEDEDGTLARLYTTPTAHLTVLVGKFIAVLATVLLQTIVLIIISSLLFGIQWGSFDRLAIVVGAQVLAASGLGVLLVSLMKNTRQAGPVLGAGLSITGMAGGLFTAANPMPAVFSTINKFTPQGWVMEGWKILMSQGPLPAFLQAAAIASVIGIVLFLAGAMIFNRRYA
jgi:ABC-2 type transport system permease protein